MVRLLPFDSDRLIVRSWPDEVLDAVGFDPRSAYVEQFWLGILGPSTTWLLRRIAAGLDEEPDGFELSLSETARALGLGDHHGRHAPFLRAVNRTIQFDVARAAGDEVLEVRRRLPPLNRRQLLRLGPQLQVAHQSWQDQQVPIPTAEAQQRRARQLALSLFELGEEADVAEHQLLRWRYAPSLAREAVAWAHQRHISALAASS